MKILTNTFTLLFIYCTFCCAFTASAFARSVHQSSKQASSQQIRSSLKDQSIFPFVQEAGLETIRGKENLPQRIAKSSEDHLIIFFASWCEFCKGEIEKYLQKVKSGDCDRVSFVSVDDEETALQNYLKAHPDFKGPIYWDKQKKLKQSLEVSRLPQVVYLARDKNIYRVENGAEKTGRQIDFIIADAEGRHGTCQ